MTGDGPRLGRRQKPRPFGREPAGRDEPTPGGRPPIPRPVAARRNAPADTGIARQAAVDWERRALYGPYCEGQARGQAS